MREQSCRGTPDGSHEYEKIELLLTLPEYSTTNPTGVFVNKIWCRDGRPRVIIAEGEWPIPDPTEPPRWLVCEHAKHSLRPDLCRVMPRLAASPTSLGLVAEGILWFLPC